MNIRNRYLLLLLLLLLYSGIVKSQSGYEWNFTTYGVKEGIRTKVNNMLQDKDGFLWLATYDGLMRYDGYAFTTFRNQENNALSIGANAVSTLTADSNDRIWVGFFTGGFASYEPSTNSFRNYNILNEHGATLNDEVSMLFADRENQIWVGVYRKGIFRFNPETGMFRHYEIVADTGSLYNPEIRKIYNSAYGAAYDAEGRIWFATHDGLYLLDKEKDILTPVREKPVQLNTIRTDLFTSILTDSTGNLWMGSWAGGISFYNPQKNQWGRYSFSKRVSPTTNIISDIRICENNCLWIASNDMGFGTFNIQKGQFDFLHINDSFRYELPVHGIYKVLEDRDKNVWISHEKGLTKIEQRKKVFYFTPVKVTRSDNPSFHHVKTILKDRKGRFQYTGTYYADGLHVRDLQSGRNEVYPVPIMRGEEDLMLVEDLLEDQNGKIWVLSRDYLLYFDTLQKKLKKHDIQPPQSGSSNQFISIQESKNGRLWISSYLNGVFEFDPVRGIIRHFHSQAKQEQRLSSDLVNALFVDSKNRVWMASRRGMISYFDPGTNQLKTVDPADFGKGYTNKTWSITEDKKGNIWLGTDKGMIQFNPDKKQHRVFSASDGIAGDIVYRSLTDMHGIIWGLTISGICRIDPESLEIRNFGEEDGLMIRDANALSLSESADGMIRVPTVAGYYSFDPSRLETLHKPYHVKFLSFKVNDKERPLYATDTLVLRSGDQFFSFDFTTVEFNQPGRLQYRYKLDGYNEQWIEAGSRRYASYTNLPGGYYTFRVKAGLSVNDANEPESVLVLRIIDPVYKRTWFLILAAAMVAGGVILLLRNRNKKIEEQKEQIEAEKIINYFAASMNDKKTEDEILWDVTRNCIGRMQFEDCVIYMLDEKNNVLVQKASHGPKSDEDDKVVSPLALPVGKGIVGSVAASGKAEIIGDTSLDERYIVDDQARLSEITVPILSDGKVIGIIDCEHSKRNFFTQKHLSILTTIASLCANKIIRVNAEKEKYDAQEELNEAQRRMKDMEMQALRAQMNPHFIFNCLNSINRYIVKSDQVTASLYLTRFAKLIRLILDNSNSKNVILSNELEALKLYIEMEALRFEHKFQYLITVEPDVNPDSVEVPPLIIQPYVENAIWHGLLHKEEKGFLSIHVSMLNGNILQCIIEDNGVGREKAKELKSKSATTRKSLGMKLTENRISLLNSHAALHATVTIEDLVEDKGQPLGTKVILKIPVDN